MGREDTESEGGAGPHDARSHREAGELSPIGWERQVGEPLRPRTPLYHAYHAERYARQDLMVLC